MLNKEDIKQKALETIESKLQELQDQLDELQQGLGSNSKSTAGDKHETGRAMLHLEQEQLGKQIEPLIRMRSILNQIDTTAIDKVAKSGSLIRTNKGLYFLSVGLGAIDLNGETVFCLSPVTPLGKKLVGSTVGQEVEHMGQAHNITELS